MADQSRFAELLGANVASGHLQLMPDGLWKVNASKPAVIPEAALVKGVEQASLAT